MSSATWRTIGGPQAPWVRVRVRVRVGVRVRVRVRVRVECHVEDDRWAAGTVERP